MDRHCKWTCMILTLQWPGSFCLILNNETICNLSPDIQNWTIHGLWPIHTGHCCSCWPIFQSHLEGLEPELSKFWPSFLKSTTAFMFWKQEWFKHGTCAACDESMGSTQLYFKTALKLRLSLRIESALADGGIKPSCDNAYRHDDLHAALRPLLGDNCVLQCVRDEKGHEVWAQLKIYFFRNQTLGCHFKEIGYADKIFQPSNSSGHPCPTETPIFYYPINYKNPKRPCQ
ncbi:ribonuclease T2-like [Chanos chanos]|uniref:Ribonuclease T2-like n=1 Tax=Chanos chanos TaxID=29144 RepID=A0A6J2VLZ6_CHACN|nr:ribonuclease T2-like [Chanos chanos]